MPADSNEHPITGPDHQLPAPARRGTTRVIVWIVILLIFALGFFFILRRKDVKPQRQGRRGAGGVATITAVTAKQGDIGVYLDAIGTVTPVHTVSITSQVKGAIVAVHYREGQLVRKGDPLIDIDPRTYQATLLQAQGVLERDQALLAQARMDLDRYRDAWKRNAISRQVLDDQEKLVIQTEGTVKNDQGAVDFDRVQLGYCHITAPFTGRVGLRLVDPGNVVQDSGGTTLAVVTQLQPITVIFTIPEDHLEQVQPRLRQAAKLPVTVFDRTAQNLIAKGSLLTLDNQIDTTTGTVKARAVFDNKGDVLFPNQFVNTRLLVNTLRNVTLLPTSAIQHNGQAAFVYVIQDNVAHVRSVKPGVNDETTTQVEGLKPGEVVANSSFEKLQDKEKVIISHRPADTDDTGSDAP
ncbi:MAG: efflux transporter periplasmic adaptor subunit [Acidobacteriales bacterium 59-55]|nr:efflux RND transporter periplasmic adaptor subunit [Terriglobales bacterium]OJV44611.1 MAG: efflux transporter periplasmic adaptor subunit [Acidobacteriales bacterium 59-55]